MIKTNILSFAWYFYKTTDNFDKRYQSLVNLTKRWLVEVAVQVIIFAAVTNTERNSVWTICEFVIEFDSLKCIRKSRVLLVLNENLKPSNVINDDRFEINNINSIGKWVIRDDPYGRRSFSPYHSTVVCHGIS